MAIANWNLLVVRPLGVDGKGGVHVDVYSISDDSELHEKLKDVPRNHRPMRQSVHRDGTIPNPVPCHWCEDCACWTKAKNGHEHPRDRIPQVGDVWVEDHTKSWIPAGRLPNNEVPFGFDWNTDPRVERIERSIQFKVLSVERDPGYEPFEYEGHKYEGTPPSVRVHYCRTLMGDWSDDDTMSASEKSVMDCCDIKDWRRYIERMAMVRP